MSFDEILTYAMKRADYKAKQIIGTNGLTPDDLDDLRQELLADVLQRLPKFNRDRSSARTFISRIIDHRIASLIAHLNAGCRDHKRDECSLDDWVRDDDGKWVRRDTTMNEDLARAHVGQARRERQEMVELVIDIAKILDTLPDDLRDLCVRLQTQTVSQIARETGTSRTCLYARIRQIRARFTEAGLRDYL